MAGCVGRDVVTGYRRAVVSRVCKREGLMGSWEGERGGGDGSDLGD